MSFQAQAWAVDIKTGSPLTKAILMALANYADQDGVSWYSHGRIASDTEMSISAVRKHVQILADKGLVTITPRTREDGSSSSNRYRLRLEVDATTEHPPCHLVTPPLPPGDTQESSTEPPHEPSPVDQPVLDVGVGLNSSSPTGGEQRQTDPDEECRFAEFWSIYPRRTAKGKARTAWSKAIRKATVGAILKGAMRYRDDPNREQQFTKHPATWLNGECWGDDPIPAKGGLQLPSNGYWPTPAGDGGMVGAGSTYWPT